MGQHAEDEIHKEMFGCYPWEEDIVDGIGGSKIIMPKSVKCSDKYLDLCGITNKKRVFRAFETLVLKKPCGKTRKSYKMIKVCTDNLELFKRFVDSNFHIFADNLKLKNLVIPELGGEG